ncbi:MAG: DUF1080 domain-containing protein [Planctomycetota bacterium]|nr:DUF1080 domain-containing protein [Planctomycetota bacterium]
MNQKSSEALPYLGVVLLFFLYIGLSLALSPRAEPGPVTGTEDEEPHWVDLFNGENFQGWASTSGEINWVIENGEMFPKSGGEATWLRTTKMYRDFELEFEFFLTPGGNSGVGLRCSHWGDPAFTGMEVQIYDTFGKDLYPGCAGAVYNAITPQSMELNEPPSWNTYRIRLVGDTLNVWLNGTQIHDDQKLDERGYFRQPEDKRPLQDRLTTGYIALQDHGHPIRFKNIRLLDLSSDPDPGKFEPLFKDASLSGWRATGNANWTMASGSLVGRDGHGHLFTDATYDNFELRVSVRVNEHGNGGVYVRAIPNPDDPDSWPVGYEAQVDQHDEKNYTGSLYDRAWGEAAPPTRDGAWFDYRIRADGDHLQTWINGELVVDAQLDAFSEGHIALQSHHQGNVIEFRDMRIRRLP